MTINDEQFKTIVSESRNIRQALIKMGLKPKGGNYKIFVNRCLSLNISLPKEELFIPQKISQKEIRETTPDFKIIDLCSTLFSRRRVLVTLGLYSETGTNVRWIDAKIKQLNINIDHWTGMAHLIGKTHDWSTPIPIEEMLVNDRHQTHTSSLKKRILKSNLLKYECAICSISSWLNETLSLHLDHIDGNNSNNVITNLRLLCPNCHSQTPTYAGKNKGKNKPK